jgi:hypothetical protein
VAYRSYLRRTVLVVGPVLFAINVGSIRSFGAPATVDTGRGLCSDEF